MRESARGKGAASNRPGPPVRGATQVTMGQETRGGAGHGPADLGAEAPEALRARGREPREERRRIAPRVQATERRLPKRTQAARRNDRIVRPLAKSKKETAAKKPHEWTSNEPGVLRKYAGLGARAILAMLNETRAADCPHAAPLTLRAVYCMAHKPRVSLRREGSRRGRRMGIPRCMRIRDLGQHADDVRNGTLDLVKIEQRIAADVKHPTPCPSCGKRPQRNPTTGLCGVCHLNHLSAALQERAVENAARRENDVSAARWPAGASRAEAVRPSGAAGRPTT
jgi:hypothetical protein